MNMYFFKDLEYILISVLVFLMLRAAFSYD